MKQNYKSIVVVCLLALALLSFSLESSKEKSFAKETVSLQVEYLKEGYIQLPKSKKDTLTDSTKVFYVKTKLKNNSSETIYFISSTCSYEDMYVTRNTELFKIYPSSLCNKNSPTLVALKADSTYEREIVIRSLVKESLIPSTCEIGFEFVEYIVGQDFDVIESFRTRHAEGNTIWSNVFELKNKK